MICNLFSEFFSTSYTSSYFNSNTNYPYLYRQLIFHMLMNKPFLDKLNKFRNCNGPGRVPNCILRRCAKTFLNDSFIMSFLSLDCKSITSNYRELLNSDQFPNYSKISLLRLYSTSRPIFYAPNRMVFVNPAQLRQTYLSLRLL